MYIYATGCGSITGSDYLTSLPPPHLYITRCCFQHHEYSHIYPLYCDILPTVLSTALLPIYTLVPRYIITHFSLHTVRVLHTSRHAGGPVSQTSDSLTGYRTPTRSSSHCHILSGLLQASWVFHILHRPDGRYILGQPAFLHSPLVRSRSSGQSSSFTAHQCDAVIRL